MSGDGKDAPFACVLVASTKPPTTAAAPTDETEVEDANMSSSYSMDGSTIIERESGI